MHFQFLIEDLSGEKLICELMKKFIKIHPGITFDCKSFRGIGGFSRKGTVKETKAGKLLNDLSVYLRGFDKSLQYIPSAIVVVLDNDDNNTNELRQKLESIVQQNMISIDCVFCIAIEEIEAWLLGDENAILEAYPNARLQALHTYVQDSICGTWETLADVVYKGGRTRMKKVCQTYGEIGKLKCEWASNIGQHMDLYNNKSPSFNFFISEIEKRAIA